MFHFIPGEAPGSENILKKGECNSTRSFFSESLNITHGTQVFITILCTNYVKLSRQLTLDPFIVIHQPPHSYGKRIHLVSQESNIYLEETANLCIPTKPNAIFYWDRFDDFHYGTEYQYRLTGNNIVYGWNSVGRRNYGQIDNTISKEDGNYTVSVRAITKQGLISSLIETNICLNSRMPEFSGRYLGLFFPLKF